VNPLTGTRRRGLSPSRLRTFATVDHPPAGLLLEATGQARTAVPRGIAARTALMQVRQADSIGGRHG